MALRQVFLFTESYAMMNPQLMIMRAEQYFDAEGRLLDEALRQRVRGGVEGLVAWTQQISPRDAD